MKSKLCRRNKFFSMGMIVFLLLFIIACGGGSDDKAPYTQADLTGTWVFHALGAGTTPRWLIFTATIDSSGHGTSSSCLDSIGTCSYVVQLPIDANGVISGSNIHMTMTSNKNFIAGTAMEGSGEYELWIIQKAVPGTVYSNADLQNKSFVFHQLKVGSSNGWHYGEGTTDATGLMTTSSITTESGPDTPGTVGTLSVDSTGAVTQDTDTSFHGFLAADKKTIIATNATGSSYNLMIYQITGQTYPAGPIPAGTSAAHLLACGVSPAPFWLHFTSTVAGSGVITFSDWVDSNGGSAPAGSHHGLISPSGTVTITEMPTYHGQVSDDGKFTVATQTNATGVYSLQVNTH